MNILFLIFEILILFGVLLFIRNLFVCVADMARRRNRDVTTWIIISLMINPIAACILLYILGDKRPS